MLKSVKSTGEFPLRLNIILGPDTKPFPLHEKALPAVFKKSRRTVGQSGRQRPCICGAVWTAWNGHQSISRCSIAIATACVRFCAYILCMILLACHMITLSLRFNMTEISQVDLPSLIHLSTSNCRGVKLKRSFCLSLMMRL